MPGAAYLKFTWLLNQFIVRCSNSYNLYADLEILVD